MGGRHEDSVDPHVERETFGVESEKSVCNTTPYEWNDVSYRGTGRVDVEFTKDGACEDHTGG